MSSRHKVDDGEIDEQSNKTQQSAAASPAASPAHAQPILSPAQAFGHFQQHLTSTQSDNGQPIVPRVILSPNTSHPSRNQAFVDSGLSEWLSRALNDLNHAEDNIDQILSRILHNVGDINLADLALQDDPQHLYKILDEAQTNIAESQLLLIKGKQRIDRGRQLIGQVLECLLHVDGPSGMKRGGVNVGEPER